MGDQPTEPSEPVVGTVQLTKNDLLGPLTQLSWLFRARVGISFILFFSVAVLWFAAAGRSAAQFLPQLLFGGLFTAYLFIAPRITAHRVFAAIARAGDTNASYRFDQDGVTIRSAGSTTSFAYRKLVQVREVKTALLLYTTPQIANIVPKRAFSVDGLDRLRALLATHVKTPIRRLGSGTRLVILWAALVLAFLVTWQFLSSRAP
jgi:hypothetical protein